jgi:hypothetical protein
VAAAAGLPQVSAPASGFPQAGKVAVVAGAGAFVGSFLPWVSVLTVFGTIELSGFDGGDGKLTAGAAVAAILFGYLGLAKGQRGLEVLGILAAAAGLAMSLYDWNNLSHLVSGADAEFAKASVGYGLYACIAGFATCFIGLWMALRASDGQR